MKVVLIQTFNLKDDGIFPNNASYPALLYKDVLKLPWLFKCAYVKRLFRRNNWNNTWVDKIYAYHHYHSITHEVLGICKGKATILLGGDQGIPVEVEPGDVLMIPAGVAHKNLTPDKSFLCVGAYPYGSDYDMNYGNAGERPKADGQIARVPVPDSDPIFGKEGGIQDYWKEKR